MTDDDKIKVIKDWRQECIDTLELSPELAAKIFMVPDNLSPEIAVTVHVLLATVQYLIDKDAETNDLRRANTF